MVKLIPTIALLILLGGCGPHVIKACHKDCPQAPTNPCVVVK